MAENESVQNSSAASDFYEQKQASYRWMEANFYDQWETAWRHYECEPTPERDQDGKIDKSLTAIGVPMTNAPVRRTVARITAQLPNPRFSHRDRDTAEFISRSLMYQWDKAGVQNLQPKHVLQAALFGWSPRPWYWKIENHKRIRRYNLRNPDILSNPEALRLIDQAYGTSLASLSMVEAALVLASLDAEKSTKGWLKVEYDYRGYEGPAADFLFAGDCFPEPGFASLRESKWFISRRDRNIEWLRNLQEAYPTLKGGVEALIAKFPKGNQKIGASTNTDEGQLRQRMLSALNQSDKVEESTNSSTWTIWERHTQGKNPKLAFMGEEQQWIGEIDYPYSIPDGRFAITECVLIDNLIHGIGDSNARFMRGIHMVHERQVGRRADLIDNILRPLLFTSNRQLYENPQLMKRYGGLRMVFTRNQGDTWLQNEQAAIAAAAASAGDDNSLYRMMAMFGDSNMTMGAEVDPSQNRTATGAKISQAMMDVLIKALNKKFELHSLSDDLSMMLALNRSEATEDLEFDASQYERRIYQKEEDRWKQKWIKVSPEVFMADGLVVAEPGSVLADDDEALVERAKTMYAVAKSDPANFNVRKASKDLLIAMGKRHELNEWEPTPPAPAGPGEFKPSLSISMKAEDMTKDERTAVLTKAGVTPGNQEQPDPPTPSGPASPLPALVAGGSGQ